MDLAKLLVAVTIGAGIVIAIVLTVLVISSNGWLPLQDQHDVDNSSGGASNTAEKGTPAITAADNAKPVLSDHLLKAKLVASGLDYPTSMAFVDDNGTLLVTEKNTGQVAMISGAFRKPILQFHVAKGAEQGLLGVASSSGTDGKRYVFFYLTETREDGMVLGNRIYRYEWDESSKTLVHPKMLISLPALPGPVHNGGKMVISKDGKELYVVIGNLNRSPSGPLCNEKSGEIDDTCVIIRMDTDGKPLPDNPFVSYGRKSMDYYYAYGVRNSFGMDFDPVTGTLWMTENGPNSYDEINVVKPGFNSGWDRLTGPMSRSNVTQGDLFSLEGSKYSDPVFSWKTPIGVTAIKFFDSDKLGEKYKDNIFVGDYNAGQLYFFKVDKDRSGLVLDGPLADLVADTYEESQKARVGLFTGGIVDLQTGPDGNLYVLVFTGKVYKISQ